MATLNYFVPDFTGGNNIPSIIGGSIITWIMYLLALRGAKSTSFLNIIGTIGKLVPVIVFILAVATVFKLGVHGGFLGHEGGIDLSFTWATSCRKCRRPCRDLWLFLESKARSWCRAGRSRKRAARKATTIGFFGHAAAVRDRLASAFGRRLPGRHRNMADLMAAIMLESFGSWGEIPHQRRRYHLGFGALARYGCSCWARCRWPQQSAPFPRHSRRKTRRRAFVDLASVDHHRRPDGADHRRTHRQQRLDHHDQHHQRHGAAVLPVLHAVPAQIALDESYLDGHSPPRNGHVHGRDRIGCTGSGSSTQAGLNYPSCRLHRVRRRPPALRRGRLAARPKARVFEKRSDKVILAVVLALGIAGLIYSVITFGNIHI